MVSGTLSQLEYGHPLVALCDSGWRSSGIILRFLGPRCPVLSTEYYPKSCYFLSLLIEKCGLVTTASLLHCRECVATQDAEIARIRSEFEASRQDALSMARAEALKHKNRLDKRLAAKRARGPSKRSAVAAAEAIAESFQ